MSPQHRSALESLIGTSLSDEQVAAVDPLIEDGRYPSIAALLSPLRFVVRSRMTSARGLAELMPGGSIAAEMVLLKLEGARDVMLESSDPQQKVIGSLLRRQLGFLSSDGLDFGSAALRSMLDQFVALSILTADEVAGLKAIALQNEPVSDTEVRAALEQ